MQPKEERERIDSLAREAVLEVMNGGRIDAAKLRTLDADVSRLQEQLRRNVGRLPPSQYMEASNFLREFDDALRMLRQPEAGPILTGKYSAQGATVDQLVKYMTSQGLLFAPKVSGDENAYNMLQRKMAEYDEEIRRSALAGTPPDNAPPSR
jgi:hypothetical protein